MSKVRNNFLKKEDFKNIKEALTSDIFPWYLNKTKTFKGKSKNKYDYQLTHTFFDDMKVNSEAFRLLKPITNLLKPQYYVRIKANLVPNTNKIHIFPIHKDQDFNCKAAILYVNTCNGMTIFKDREVKSKENTMVFFNADENHQGTTCSDEKYKILINFNYQ